MPAKLLFVDDESDLEVLIRQYFRAKIRVKEVEVFFAQNGNEALAVLQASPDIDVMFSDINMPHMDGLTLLDEVSKLSLPLKTIMVTAYGDMRNIRAAMNRGAFDFLTKPLEFADLETTIAKSLKVVNLLKEAEQTRLKALELEERNRFIRDTFGRYISERVVTSLLDRPEGLRIGGEKRKITVLMSDLRGFTVLAERLHPEQVLKILNHYLETMIDIITAYQGTIIEIMGDGILVIFGAPLEQPDAAERAVACALAMQLAMPAINDHQSREESMELEMGIGINSGDVVVGNIGSQKHAKYTVIGSTINLASRIESYATGDQILISESLYQEIASLLSVRRSFAVKPKGAKQPLLVYEIIGINGTHQLMLPDIDRKMTLLAPSWPVTFAILDNKKVDAAGQPGQLTAISHKLARLTSARVPDFLDNIKLTLHLSSDDNNETSEIYAKVIEISNVANEGSVTLRFTAISPASIIKIREHCLLAINPAQ